MGKTYARELPATTYEGDNFILNQQVVRAGLKTLKSFSTGEITELAPSSAYLASLSKPFTPLSTAPSNWLNHELILQLISPRAAKQVERVAKLIQNLTQVCISSSFGFFHLSHQNVSKTIWTQSTR